MIPLMYRSKRSLELVVGVLPISTETVIAAELPHLLNCLLLLVSFLTRYFISWHFVGSLTAFW